MSWLWVYVFVGFEFLVLPCFSHQSDLLFLNIFNNIVKFFGLHSCFSFFCSFPAFPALCREFCPSVYVVVIYTSSWCFPPHVYLLITLSSSCLCILDKLSHVPRGATVPFALVHSKCSLEFGWFLSVWHFSYLDFFVY